MKYFSISILMLLVFGCVGYTEKKGILRTDNCDAPGLEWMEAVEGYDKQEVIDLASRFEAAAKADAEQLKTVLNGSMAFSITASLREIVRNTSGRTVNVSQAFYEKANTYRASICNIERWLKNGTISDPLVRLRAEKMLLSLSDNFNAIAANEKSVTNIISINQHGGITAGTVNISPQARTLNAGLTLQLENLLKDHKRSKVDIVAVLGDQEAYQFATQIDEYLKEHGYLTSGVSQAVFSKPALGQNVEFGTDTVKIVIGGRQ
jgi:hypothetical protein